MKKVTQNRVGEVFYVTCHFLPSYVSKTAWSLIFHRGASSKRNRVGDRPPTSIPSLELTSSAATIIPLNFQEGFAWKQVAALNVISIKRITLRAVFHARFQLRQTPILATTAPKAVTRNEHQPWSGAWRCFLLATAHVRCESEPSPPSGATEAVRALRSSPRRSSP